MKTLLLKILFLAICIDAFSTAQIPDRLIYNGDTISLFDCPLEYYPNREIINPRNLFGGSGCFYTACWRNYVATWKIENNKLYLVQIRNACYPTDSEYVGISIHAGADTIGKEYADLKSLFPDRFENGKVLADWVSTTMISPLGNLLFYIHDGFESIFERELEFTLKNGNLINTQEYDNSKTKKSKYTSDSYLRDFIENSINYSNVPYPDKEIRVVIRIMGSTEDGIVDGVSILKGYNDIYDKEALRVVNSIPEWDIIYKHGKKIDIPWMIPVIFRPKN
jgi:hypothetical protein